MGRARIWVAALSAVLVSACSAPAPPTPNIARSTPIPSPQTAAAVVGDDVDEVEPAFQTEVVNILEEAQALASGSCEGLQALGRQDTQAFQRLRDLGEVLKSVARTDPALTSDITRQLVEDLDEALADMDLQLGFCGISPTRAPTGSTLNLTESVA